MKLPKNKEELLEVLKEIDACKEAIEWCRKQDSLEEIYKCNYGNWWSTLLTSRPEFEKHCDWKFFDGWDWTYLLIERPKFKKYCDWNKLDGWDWIWLLFRRPEFSKYCDWTKLSERSWRWLLSYRPQFEKYRPKETV